MKIHLLTGFLGSGKTTAIQQACTALLQQGESVGVITNDQGMHLVDGDFFESSNIPGRQVKQGCFCCKYKDLDASITSLINEHNPSVIFAESVGSCTDIVATVLKPLLQFRPEATVTISTFTDIRLLKMILEDTARFDTSVSYIYHKQLEEARLVIINKTDLVDAGAIEKVEQLMHEKYPSKKLLFQHSLDQQNIQEWLGHLEQGADTSPGSLDINYDIYAEGEAMLAWFDQSIEIYSLQSNALECAADIISGIYKAVEQQQLEVGHMKFLMNDQIKISFTNAAQSPEAIETYPAASAKLLINLRVQTSPAKLSAIVEKVFSDVHLLYDCKIISNSAASFQPGYPRPVYRM